MRVRRPAVRGDCVGPTAWHTQRPCPFVLCRHHLWPETAHGGSESIGRAKAPKLSKVDPLTMRYSCALDLADGHKVGGMTLEEVGAVLGVTRERARQVEATAADSLRRDGRSDDLQLAVKELGGIGPEGSPGGWVYPPAAPVITEAEQRRAAAAVWRAERGTSNCLRSGCTRVLSAGTNRKKRLVPGYCSWTCACAAGVVLPRRKYPQVAEAVP